MKLLIRAARVIDSRSPYNGQVRDLLIENGLIREVGEGLAADEKTRVIEGENLCVSPGWFDLRVAGRDPGYEHKEDLKTVCRVAARGGFTDLAILPNTRPAIDSKDTLAYIRHSTLGQVVSVHPIAAVTKGAEGKDFTEMIDLHHAGAVAFSDGEHPLTNPDLLVKTIQYLRPFDGLLMNRPEETKLTHFGQMNEGLTSTQLGLKGMPAIAEELIVERDLRLLAYALETGNTPEETPAGKSLTEGPLPCLHFSVISTARSVDLIRQAKAAGLPVSCDVAAHQLVYDETALMAFDTNLKVNPPFRLASDVEALRQGVIDGTIDAVVSDHSPQDEESKNLEFDQAEFGILGLETVFSLLRTHLPELSLEQLVDRLTYQPRRILRLPVHTVAENEPATLTVFDPDRPWVYQRTASRSRNTPFLGQELRGKALWVINKGLADHTE